MGSPSMDISRRLSRFVEATRWEDLPDKVRHEAKRSLLNFLGTALAGCRDEAVEGIVAVLSDFSGPRNASLIGRHERFDALSAAFVNAAAGNVHDFDDTHVPTVIHPTAPIAPPLLALAETRRVSGQDLLVAFALGVDVACRLGNAISPRHYDRGWHITSTCGVFGAATAAGKILGLGAEQLNWALGNASAQSAGLVETLGSMAKSVGVGNSARAGLLSALLAERGLAGPDRPIEGPRGFTSVMGEGADPDAIVADLGRRWEILFNTYKPYPCGVVLNPVIDACLELRRRHPDAAGQAHRIAVRGHPLLAARTDRPGVTTGREAQVSAQHSVAVTLLTGAAGLAQFSNAAVNDPVVLALRARVAVERDATIPVGAAFVILEMRGGTSATARIDHATGSQERPLTDREIETKLRTIAAYCCPSFDVAALIDTVWSLDRLDDAGALTRLLRIPRQIFP